MITVAGRVLMTSVLMRSEVAVAVLGCAPVRDRAAPRVLIGGLGLGFTLRAALDVLPRRASVTVAELNPRVVEWCRGPVAVLTDDALSDPRVNVVVGDVIREVRAVASAGKRPRWDAIVLDLYEGPRAEARSKSRAGSGAVDPLYGPEVLAKVWEALSPGGAYAVWSEDPDPSFEKRLRDLGFRLELTRTHGGGPRHAVYVARKPPAPG